MGTTVRSTALKLRLALAPIGRSVAAAALALVLAMAAPAGDLGNQFVRATLGYGAAVDVPRAWQVVRGHELQALETAAGSAIDLSGYAQAANGTQTLLVAVFPHPTLYAGVTITAISAPGVTADTVAKMSDAQVASGQSVIRQGIEASQRQLGSTVTGWTALRKETLGSRMVMHTSYVRSGESGTRHVDLYKVFASGRVFDIVLSTNVDAASVNRAVLSRIATSFWAP